MITKFVANYSSRGMILLILITYFLPNFSSIDRSGNQWLYLSIINFIGIFEIYFKYNGDLKLFYIKKVYALRWYLLFIITGFMSFFSRVLFILFTIDSQIFSGISLGLLRLVYCCLLITLKACPAKNC